MLSNKSHRKCVAVFTSTLPIDALPCQVISKSSLCKRKSRAMIRAVTTVFLLSDIMVVAEVIGTRRLATVDAVVIPEAPTFAEVAEPMPRTVVDAGLRCEQPEPCG